MKKLLLILIAIATISSVKAQFIKRMADRAKNKIEQKAGEKVEKGVDDAASGKKNEKKETEAENKPAGDGGAVTKSDEEPSSTTSAKPTTLKTYSKYDFVPGEKVIAFEDFATADIGDFPARWNTNSTAEVVTVSGKEGKWLKFQKEGILYPEFITSLPENFTLEFDLGVNDEWNSYAFVVDIAKLKSPETFAQYGRYISWQGDHALQLDFKPSVSTSRVDGNSRLMASKDGNYLVNNAVQYGNWDNAGNKFAHVSIWRQKLRLRVYMNGEKIWDIPRAFDPVATYNAITLAVQGTYRPDDFYLFSNLRLAIGAPDTRNKLVTEGKFVTTGILFDVNKDVIRPESYGTLKDIANVLKENAGIKVKIVGHTDSDGDEKMNLELSKNRAEAVKAALMKEFEIDESRMETDGKGESQPADKNDSASGKANNRRVEFIKL